jgi:parallel beta-helix repeat protein
MLGKTKRNLSPEETRCFYFSIFAIALLVSSMQAESTLARTWHIKADGTGDAPTIQAGVDSAAAGDTVLVAGGIYSDTTYAAIYTVPVPVNVHLHKNISLIGESAPPGVVIDGKYSAAAIYVHDVDSTALIQSLRIKRVDPYIWCILDSRSRMPENETLQSGSGINSRFSSVRIVGNELVDLGYGIRIEGGAPAARDNKFLRTSVGVSVTGSTTADISGNQFHTFDVAIGGSGCAPRITGNLFQGTGNSCSGIYTDHATPYISNNHFENLEYDAIYLSASRATIVANWIKGAAWDAIYLLGCDSSRVEYNTLVQNAVGIVIEQSYSVTIRNNTLDGLGAEGIVVTTASDPVIDNNIISRIRYAVECDPSTSPTFACNNVFDAYVRYTGCSDQTGLNGNFALDPQYCGIDDSGNYFLQSDSPCAPGNHPTGYDCGLIGAHDVKCGKVEAAQKSWGGIKSLYRKEECHDQ